MVDSKVSELEEGHGITYSVFDWKRRKVKDVCMYACKVSK
jgi:hypothetical protein